MLKASLEESVAKYGRKHGPILWFQHASKDFFTSLMIATKAA